MAITTRAQKGSPLTHAEMDANFQALKDLVSVGVGGAIDWTNPINITTTPTTLTAGKHHVITETIADRTHTLPAATSCAGKLISIQIAASTTKLITIDGNASETIDGSLTRIMWANETAILLSNGTTWTKVGGKTIPMMAGIAKGANQTFSNSVETKVVLNTNLYTPSVSSMHDLANSRIYIRRTGLYTITASNFWNNTNSSVSSRLNTAFYLNGGGFNIPVSSYCAANQYLSHFISVQTNLTDGNYLENFALYTAGSYSTNFSIDSRLIVVEIPTW